MLFALLHQYKPGDEVKLVIDRQGKRKEFTVVARLRDDGGDRIPRQEKSRKDDTLNDLGLILEETDKGIVVTGISPGSPASRQDLRRGDLILEVNRQRMKKIRDMDQALAGTKNDMAVLYVERRGSKFFVPIRTGDGGK